MAPPSKRVINGRINGIKSKDAEKKKLQLENSELKTKLQDATNKSNILSEKVQEYEGKIADISSRLIATEESLRSEKWSHQETKMILKQIQNTAGLLEIESNKKLANLQKELDEMILKSPARGKSLKKYKSVISQPTIDSRCERIVETMEGFVGSESLDLIATDLVNYMSKSDTFTFRLSFTPEETFHLATRLKLSSGDMRIIKRYMKSKLGFDVMASRQSVENIRKQSDPKQYYDIEISKESKIVCGRKFEIPKATVTCFDIKSLLKRRLESLDYFCNLVFDIGTGDAIALTITGDKGGDVTKLCLVLENCVKPNSSHSLLLLGYYNGNDDYKGLKKHFGCIFEQLNSLESIEFMEGGVLSKRKIKKKIAGDCKFLSALYEHPGQSSSDPCFICSVSICKSGRNRDCLGEFDFDAIFPIRTLQSMREEGYCPLLNEEPTSCQPPPLHILMGITKSYVMDPLFATCNMYDFPFGDLPETLKEQREYFKLLKEEEEEYIRVLTGLQFTADFMQSYIQSLETMSRKKINLKASFVSCDSSHCCIELLPNSHKNQEVFSCSKCSSTFHTCCAGYFSIDAAHKATREPSQCFDCRENMIMTIAEKKDSIEEQLEMMNRKIEDQTNLVYNVSDERERLEKQLKESEGKTRQKLESVLVSIGCDPRAHYQQLTGNQVRKYCRTLKTSSFQTQSLLKPVNIDKILSVFPDDFDTNETKQLMTLMSRVMSFSNNAIKSDVEIDEFRTILHELVSKLKEVHPKLSVLPKLHILSSHLMSFVEENGSWGRTSEQGMEAFHPLFKSLQGRYATVQNPRLRAHLIIQHIMNVNWLCDKGDSWLN